MDKVGIDVMHVFEPRAVGIDPQKMRSIEHEVLPEVAAKTGGSDQHSNNPHAHSSAAADSNGASPGRGRPLRAQGRQQNAFSEVRPKRPQRGAFSTQLVHRNSKRSRVITLDHASTKSFTNASWPSSDA